LPEQKDVNATRRVVADHRDALKAEIERIRAESAPIRAERAKLQEEVFGLERMMEELQGRIEAIERPHLGRMENELAALERALGAKSLQAETRAPAPAPAQEQG
jgi:predicted nuclease with TOPRIM domain